MSIMNVLTVREDGISKQITMKRQHLLAVMEEREEEKLQITAYMK